MIKLLFILYRNSTIILMAALPCLFSGCGTTISQPCLDVDADTWMTDGSSVAFIDTIKLPAASKRNKHRYEGITDQVASGTRILPAGKYQTEAEWAIVFDQPLESYESRDELCMAKVALHGMIDVKNLESMSTRDVVSWGSFSAKNNVMTPDGIYAGLTLQELVEKLKHAKGKKSPYVKVYFSTLDKEKLCYQSSIGDLYEMAPHLIDLADEIRIVCIGQNSDDPVLPKLRTINLGANGSKSAFIKPKFSQFLGLLSGPRGEKSESQALEQCEQESEAQARKCFDLFHRSASGMAKRAMRKGHCLASGSATLLLQLDHCTKVSSAKITVKTQEDDL